MAKNKPIPKVKVEQLGAVTTVYSDKPLKVFATSDVHWDSYYSYREQFISDMEYARKLGALIIIFGDFLDVMQGRYDPRRHMEYVRPEYRREAYYDAVVDCTIRDMRPYRNSILFFAHGNHEDAAKKNAGTDVLHRLIEGLNTPNHTIYEGGYGGILNFIINEKVNKTKYFHGAGGEAPVTKGVIQTNRQAAVLNGFDIVFNGHNHNAYHVPIAQETVDNDGIHRFMLQHHIRTPGYSMAFGDGSEGWEVTRGGVPKPIGGYFVDFNGDPKDLVITSRLSTPIPIRIKFDLYDGPIYPEE